MKSPLFSNISVGQVFINLFLGVMICLSFCSCSVLKTMTSYSQFKEIRSARFRKISLALKDVGTINDFAVYKSYIIVISACRTEGELIHIYNKYNGSLIMDTLYTGNGYGEIRSNSDCSINTVTGVIEFFDAANSKHLSFQIDTLLLKNSNSIFESAYNENTIANRQTFETEYGRLVVNNLTYFWDSIENIPRLRLTDSSGMVLSEIYGYHFIGQENKDKFRYGKNLVTLSPDNTKFAVAIPLGGIMDLYSLCGLQITNTATSSLICIDSLFVDEFTLKNNGDNVYTFSDICSTNKKIYCVFDGENSKSKVISQTNGLLYSKIAIYDWMANGLFLIITDYEIEQAFVPEDGKFLYAIIKDNNGDRFIGRLRLPYRYRC